MHGFFNFRHGPVCKKLSHWSAAPTCMAASGALNMSCVVPSFLQNYLFLFVIGKMWTKLILTICLSCLMFSWHATDDCTLLFPFSSIFVFCRHNYELILDRFLFIIPCVFPAFYMYIIEPIVGFVNLWYWIPVKGQLRMAFLDWFLTGFHWL